MRIAVLVRDYSPISGFDLVVRNLLVGLAQQHEIRMFEVAPGYYKNRRGSSELPPYPWEQYTQCSTSSENRQLSRASRFYGANPERLEWIERCVLAYGPDRIIGFGYDIVPFVGLLRSDVPKIVNVIDSEILYSLRELRSGNFGGELVKHFLAAILVGRECFRKFAATVTVSSSDTENVKRYGGARNVFTVPNGVDHDRFAPNPSIRRLEPSQVIFCGSLGFPPNVQAVEWFVTKCWDEIRRLQPNAEFLVIGKNPPADLAPRLESYSGVRVIGFVDDVRRHILESAVSVAPMVSGTGIKNKILEAWALATPVVATPRAIEGLICEHDVNLLIARSPSEFAAATASLLADRERRERIGAAGRSHVIEHYCWEKHRAKFNSIVEAPLGYREAAADGREQVY